jgi:hypothetical protein
MFLRLVLISMWLVSSHAFVRAPAQLIHSDMNRLQRSTRCSKSKLDLFLTPQIGFAAACAGAVFAYVYSNIDSIKEVSFSLQIFDFIYQLNLIRREILVI